MCHDWLNVSGHSLLILTIESKNQKICLKVKKTVIFQKIRLKIVDCLKGFSSAVQRELAWIAYFPVSHQPKTEGRKHGLLSCSAADNSLK